MSSTNLAFFNAKRANLLIDTLYNQGIHNFCVAPGSRSTPLALAIGEHPKAKAFIHFDERGLGFYALGLAKALKTPVALLVTTGTAVANLFPAIMEAHLSRIPLLILSADRPPELRDCGANQTADHIKIFESFTRWETDLAFSDPLASDEYIISTLAHAVDRCFKSPAGPVQVNCMIREPFIYLDTFSKEDHISCVYESRNTTPPVTTFKTWGTLLSQKEKGVILLGSDALQESDLDSFLLLAEKLNWPIFSDIISGGRQIGDHPCHIEHFEFLIKALPDMQADVILQIGNRFVSKSLQQWIQKQKTSSYFFVADHPFRQDPLHRVSRRMECNTDLFCKSLINWITPPLNSWTFLWKSAAILTKQIIAEHFLKNEAFTEPSLFSFFNSQNPSFPFFLSNSMPVRDADLLFYPLEGNSSFFCNRGSSGIDGNIATAAGIAEGLQKPLIAILGDLATLHDINSLSLVSKSKIPIILIIINNQGGGIFSFLPVAEKKELFEEFIATSHPYSFSLISETFSLPYAKVDSLESLEKTWKQAQKTKTHFVIECSTERKSNVIHHQTLYDKVSKQLCSFMKSLEVSL